jgi:hypothetical protein
VGVGAGTSGAAQRGQGANAVTMRGACSTKRRPSTSASTLAAAARSEAAVAQRDDPEPDGGQAGKQREAGARRGPGGGGADLERQTDQRLRRRFGWRHGGYPSTATAARR